MTKNILAIAIAAAVMAPSAFAAATVYGIAHVGIAQQDGTTTGSSATAAGSASSNQMSVLSNSSRLGIKGDEDLGAGLKAVYQMEMAVNMDGEGGTAAGSAVKDSFGAGLRNTFAGIGGGFGTVLVGRHDSPIKLTGRSYDLFGDQIGNNRNILGAAASATSGLVDGRHSNVVAYATPTFGGFSGLIAYVPGAGNDDLKGATTENWSSDATKTNAWSAMAGYKAGAFGASVGYITIDNARSSTGTSNSAFNATRVGAEYTFGAAKVVALYQNADMINGSASADKKAQDVWGLGGQYKITSAGTIKAQYYVAGNASSTDKSGATMTSVGYDHAMSKNTTAYVAYTLVDNDAAGTYTANMSNGGSSDNTAAVTGKDNSAMSVGLIHKF